MHSEKQKINLYFLLCAHVVGENPEAGGGRELIWSVGEGVPGCVEWTGRRQESGEIQRRIWKAHHSSEEVTREREEADDKMPRAESRDQLQLCQSGDGPEAVSWRPDHHYVTEKGIVWAIKD